MPRPPFTRQALNSFVVTSSTQINAGSWTTWDSFPWLIETNRRTGDPSEKLLLNETRLHRKSLFPTRFMPILPLSTPVIKTTNKRKYVHFINVNFFILNFRIILTFGLSFSQVRQWRTCNLMVKVANVQRQLSRMNAVGNVSKLAERKYFAVCLCVTHDERKWYI